MGERKSKKSAKVSLFFGLNKLEVMTPDRRHPTVCGYTQAALEQFIARDYADKYRGLPGERVHEIGAVFARAARKLITCDARENRGGDPMDKENGMRRQGMLWCFQMALALLLAAVRPPAANAEQRLALVIGNAAYQSGALKNPVNDARLIGKALQQAGFSLYGGSIHENLGYQKMLATVEGFGKAITPQGVCMIFYAGHGMQVGGNNYLIPVDAAIKGENEVAYKAVPVGLLLAKLEQGRSRLNVVVLDACRDNPFARSFRTSAAGLTSMTAPAGTIVAYSTGPGHTVEDGTEENSVYSKALAAAMQEQGKSIEEVFKRVRTEVRSRTNRQQTPWEHTSLEGMFYFRVGSGAAAAPGQATSPEPEAELWNLVRNSDTVADVEKYLQQYPRGKYAAAASVRKEQLARRQPVLVAGGDPPLREQTSGSSLQSTTSTTSTSSTSSKPKAGDSFTDSLAGEFVFVPGGEFMMGSDDGASDEKPPHQVRVSGFYMGKNEVTVGQYLACVADKDCPEPEWRESGSKYHYQSGSENHYKKLGASLTGGRNPIVGVNWDNAQDFAAWLRKKSGKNYRLPSEAEWEYAARSGGRNEKWSGTSDESRLKDYAWYGTNSDNTTHEVGTRQANGLGLYDMSGNVWEWVQDCWHDNYAPNPPLDGTAWETSCQGSNRVFRGGSWSHAARDARAANRYGSSPGLRSDNLGFRLALPLGQQGEAAGR